MSTHTSPTIRHRGSVASRRSPAGCSLLHPFDFQPTPASPPGGHTVVASLVEAIYLFVSSVSAYLAIGSAATWHPTSPLSRRRVAAELTPTQPQLYTRDTRSCVTDCGTLRPLTSTLIN